MLWSNLIAAAVASALRRDDHLPIIVAFLAWDLWDVVAGASFTDTLTTTLDFIRGAGFLLGSTL